MQAGTICRQLTGNKPRIALLSFSTKGSANLASPQKMVAATALARKKAEEQMLEMEIDGELQADTALLPDLASRKAPTSLVAGKANVLVFPDLNSGNIGAKLVQYPRRRGNLWANPARTFAALRRSLARRHRG
ncbi:MAG: phosphate acyltransferase [Chthoniobacter sp.]